MGGPRLARAGHPAGGCDGGEPILWILTLRSDGDHVTRLRGLLGDGARVIALAPLDAADAARLVDHVIGDRALAPAARERIESRAAGNPSRLILGALLAGAVESELAHEATTVERAARPSAGG